MNNNKENYKNAMNQIHPNEKLKSESVLFSQIFNGRLQNIIHGNKESLKKITRESVIKKYNELS